MCLARRRRDAAERTHGQARQGAAVVEISRPDRPEPRRPRVPGVESARLNQAGKQNTARTRIIILIIYIDYTSILFHIHSANA